MSEMLRVTNVRIDTAKIHGDNWVRADVQTLEVDDDLNVISERISDKNIYRNVKNVALEQHTFMNPVTQQKMTLTTLEIAQAIKAAMINWMLEDFDATLIEDKGLVFLNADD